MCPCKAEAASLNSGGVPPKPGWEHGPGSLGGGGAAVKQGGGEGVL